MVVVVVVYWLLGIPWAGFHLAILTVPHGEKKMSKGEKEKEEEEKKKRKIQRIFFLYSVQKKRGGRKEGELWGG